MKNKILSIIAILLVLLLNACSPLTIAASSGEQPTPGEAFEPPSSDYRPVIVENVQVQVGVGSPIPVEIVAGGTWPDLCSQIAEVKSQIKGFQIDVTVLSSTVTPCPPDQVGLSFRFALPLNMVEMQSGTYVITVNGAGTTFDWPVKPDQATASISGWLWHDKCDSGMDGEPGPTSTPNGCVQGDSPIGPYTANGIMEPDEQPIESVRIRLFAGECGSNSLNPAGETQTLATDRSYSFTGLKAGTYCVVIDPQSEPNFTILGPGIWTHPYVMSGVITRTVILQPEEKKVAMNFGWDYQFK